MRLRVSAWACILSKAGQNVDTGHAGDTGAMLTERSIRDARPAAKAFIMWDAKLKGFGVRVAPGGTRTYVIDYRAGGRHRRARLARVGELSLREARERAARELAGIRAGESDPLERRRTAREAPTVDDALRRYFEEFAPGRKRMGRLAPKTIEEYGYVARRYLSPAVGSRRVADVGRHEVEGLVDRLPGPQRNRVLAFASRLFTLCEQWEWRDQHSNPVRGVERAREEPRDRVLAPSELAALSEALEQLHERFPASVAAIRVAATTGLRIGEVIGIEWQHVDFETGQLTLPQTKTGRRTHHLPVAAQEVLRTMPQINGVPWVFTTTARAAVTYRTVQQCFMRAVKLSGVEDARIHDLRRTVMTRAAAAGVGTHVLRDLLGHKTTVMADRYVRSVGSPVADAREAIGAAMAAAMARKVGHN